MDRLKAMENYKDFLEEVCKVCATDQPTSCCFVAKCEDGLMYSGYTGEASESPYEKMTLANVVNADAMMEITLRNARDVVEAAEDEEEFDED